MDDAALVGVVDRVAEGAEQLQPQLQLIVPDGRRPAFQPPVQGHSRDQLHREEVVAVVGVARLVDGGDVGVLEAGEGLGLAEEQTRVQVVDDVIAAHHLEGDAASRPLLLGLPHHSHAALAEQTDDAIAGDRDGSGAVAPVGRRGLVSRCRESRLRCGRIHGGECFVVALGRTRTTSAAPVLVVGHCPPKLCTRSMAEKAPGRTFLFQRGR